MFKKILLSTTIFLFVFISYSQDSEYNILTIPTELKENANSVIQLDKTIIDIKSQREMTIDTEVVITVLNKLGNSNADVTIYYDKAKRIQNVSAIYYDAFGNEIKKIKKKDFQDYSASGSNLFSDSRVIHYDYTPIKYPYTVHYKYQIKTSNTAFIPRWVYLSSYYKSIKKSIFKINYPLDIELKKVEKNFKNYTIKSVDEPGKLSYICNNILAVKKEPLSPYILDFIPSSIFAINKFNIEGIDGEADDWKELGKWEYENLYKDVGELPNDVKEQVKKLVVGVEDPIEKSKIIYQYVQDKVRYISIQVGIGGLKPMLASDVDKLGYGDCKALTNYTKSLLDAVGVNSYFTELYGSRNKTNMEFNSPSVQGNHVILNIPHDEGDIWLECTSQNVPFGHIAGFTDDRDVIVVKPEGGELVHTRIYNEKENLQTIKGKYVLNNDGHISAEIQIEMKGSQFNRHLQYEKGSPKELEELFKNVWDNINNMDIKSATVNNNKKDEKFEETVIFTAENYGVKSGDRMIFPINAFNVSGKAPKRVRDRKLPVDISFGFYDVDEVIIDLPLDYVIEVISDNVSLETEFGTYKSTITKISESQLSYKREYLLKNGQYPKEAYKAYRGFI
jgi:hypothetical protein